MLFGGIGSLLIGSVGYGFGVITGGAAGLAVFGAVMVGVLRLAVRVPTPGLPFVSMARSNLGRHPARAASALVALFVGTFAIGVSALVIRNAQEELVSRMLDEGQVSVTAYGIPADDPNVVRLASGAAVWTDRTAPAEITRMDGSGFSVLGEVHGRGADGASTATVLDTLRGGRGDAWLSDPGGVLLPWHAHTDSISVGDSLRIRVAGSERVLAVDGFYDRPSGIQLVPTSGAIVLPETFEAFSNGPVTELVAAEVPADDAEAFAAALGAARPDGAVITSQDVADFFVRLVRGLFWVVLALTSLALVAGTVLIANGVGLALVERRRELGVLKAIGYSAGQVLRVLVWENALLGLVGGGLGVAAAVLLMVVTREAGDVPFTIYPSVVAGLVAVAVLLAVGSALLWRPVRARPLDVLRGD